MSKPIEAGCLAEVISGVLGDQSPNKGLIVKVLHRDGEHTQHGPIWLCEAEYAELAQPGTRDVSGGKAHFAQAWLRRIDGPEKGINTETKKEITV